MTRARQARAPAGAEPVSMPLVGRLYESGQSHEDAWAQDPLARDALSHDALSHDALSHDALSHDALSHDALPHDALTQDALSHDALTQDAPAQDRRARDIPAQPGPLPFVGSIVQCVPWQSITVERTLDLGEDCYLADHAFVHAPGVKPLSACLPVLPMTMSLEVMAEVAACIVPGHGLIGFEDVKATRWIELADTEQVALRITARLDRIEPDHRTFRIAVAVAIGEQPNPAITACALFGMRYRADLALQFTAFEQARTSALRAEEIYRERYLFHGPRFQCLCEEIVVAERGVEARLLVQPTANLFRSHANPQLLADPALLDGVGQLLGLWALQQDRFAFPIGLRKLEICRPRPPEGTRVPIRIEIESDEARTVYCSVEIQDGAGGVWMRIAGWGGFKFRWPRRLLDFRRQPTRHLLSHVVQLADLPGTARCCLIADQGLAGFDRALLARYCLDGEETSAFVAKAGIAERQRQWLLGRIAAKDAVRLWLAGGDRSAELLHPAAFAIGNDARGQPVVARLHGQQRVAKLSIAHCEDRAIAIADTEPVGVDIERVQVREDAFVADLCTPAERSLLAAAVADGDVERTAEWITRLWCAKEAVGKLLATGVPGSPRRFEAVDMAADGTVRIVVHGTNRPPDRATDHSTDGAADRATDRAADHSTDRAADRATDRPIAARTLRQGDFVFAWASAGEAS